MVVGSADGRMSGGESEEEAGMAVVVVVVVVEGDGVGWEVRVLLLVGVETPAATFQIVATRVLSFWMRKGVEV